MEYSMPVESTYQEDFLCAVMTFVLFAVTMEPLSGAIHKNVGVQCGYPKSVKANNKSVH